VSLPATGRDNLVRDRLVRALFDGMAREPWGQTSASVYETGRLVTLAPWLTGHADRVRWLLSNQRPDGTWGAPDGYALVPTLSAVEALLATLDRADTDGDRRIAAAVDRGLRALLALLTAADAATLPDTPAADLLIPVLVDRVNDRTGGHPRLPLPAGMDAGRLMAVRRFLLSDGPVPYKLLHAAEAVPDLVRNAADVGPVGPGSVGASPAATAAWLGTDPATATPGADADRARAYLDAVVRRHGGPVPCAVPITAFERSWVLSTLARVGVPLPDVSHLRRELAAALGPDGTAAGPGLPVDADTTAVTLFALALLGEPVDPGCLWAYRVGPRFCTWPGENGVSITTNAHVLDAFGIHHGESGHNVAIAVEQLAKWLCGQQNADGSWIDRWHASLYYATSCCVLALDRYGRAGSASRAVGSTVDRAIEWVLATQRPDGSWGRWAGTTEETAYAMHVLLGTRRAIDGRIVEASARGRAYIETTLDRPGPALWHDKDLYRPAAIVRAAAIAALHLSGRAST
jgi:halimadienyl-diphosphate synthase